MPLHSDKPINSHARVVVWEIDETVDWFLSQLHLDPEELEKYEGFRTDQRRVHWLAYRYILKNILGKGNKIRVRYDEHNKPFIDLSDDHISVSHSGRFAAVILSKKYPVGIDVEEINPRLHRVADKFLTVQETGKDVDKLSTEELCLHWCAKETLYKLYGERKLDFREHIRIQNPPGKQEGPFEGIILHKEHQHRYGLVSERLGEYCLVYATGHLL